LSEIRDIRTYNSEACEVELLTLKMSNVRYARAETEKSKQLRHSQKLTFLGQIRLDSFLNDTRARCHSWRLWNGVSP